MTLIFSCPHFLNIVLSMFTYQPNVGNLNLFYFINRTKHTLPSTSMTSELGVGRGDVSSFG